MKNDYSALDDIAEDDKKDALIERLQSTLADIKEARREERFCWVMAVIILVNVIFFSKLDGLSAISIVFLQLILLVILSRKLGVETLTEVLDKYVLSHPMNPIRKKDSEQIN